MSLIEIAISLLVLVSIIATFTEGFGVLFSSMKTSDQEVWEYDHVNDKGYRRRHRQLVVQLAGMATTALVCVALAINYLHTYTAPVNYNLINPQEPSDGLVFTAIVLMVVALVCCARIGILRAKLKAIKTVQAKLLKADKQQPPA